VLTFAACVVTTAAIGAWYGCSVYDPSLLLPAEEPETGPEAAPPADAGHEAAPEAANPCPETLVPPRPAADDPADGGDTTFIAALHTIDLGIRDDGGTPPLFGYDLDGVYTCCDGGASSCTPPVVGAHCDEMGGRDNSGGQLISSLSLLDPTQFNATTISQRLQAGVYSLILQIENYNGTQNDTQVVAGIYASEGIQAVGDAAPPPAKWDGTDVWTIDQSFVLSGGGGSPLVPSHYDAHAYVAGGLLVMQVNFPISLGTTNTGNITVALTGGVITGQVEPAGNGTYKLTGGQVAGRWTAASVLFAAQQLTLGGASICPGTSLYTQVKGQVCAAADITTDPSKDNQGATCDALSVAFGFTADPATLGNVVATPSKTALCDGGNPNDTCATP
jgi:hypothetical protein